MNIMNNKPSLMKSILIVLLLMFLPPVGLILMRKVSGWNKNVKMLIYVIFAIITVAYIRFFIMIYEADKSNKSFDECITSCQQMYGVGETGSCSQGCFKITEDFNNRWGSR